MSKTFDVEQAVDLVEEIFNEFKKGRDLEDIFYFHYGPDFFYCSARGGPLVRFDWDSEAKDYEHCHTLMKELADTLRERKEVLDLETELHEDWYDNVPIKGQTWYIEFSP